MFTEEERLIFPFEVRGVKRWADPLAVWRRFLRASGGRFSALCRDARGAECVPPGDGSDAEARHEADLRREAAREELYAVICTTFDLTPFDPDSGKGTVESEAVSLLNDFLEWSEGNAKPGGGSPGTSPCTATHPDSPSTT